jgi:hypothetical protein
MLSDITFQKVSASDFAAGDHFGRAVSLAGDIAVIGAMSDDNNAGASYVFTRASGLWSQHVKLTPAVRSSEARFGRSVSISGNTIAIGAELDPEVSTNAGAAYVFDNVGGVWIEQAKLLPVDLAQGDRFGTSVALSGDYLLVGSPRDDDRGSNSGSAYVFKREISGWEQKAKLTALDGAGNDQFGFCCAMDGEYAVIGAWQDNNNTGAAYVFKRDGESWTQQAKLTASDGAPGDYFGSWWIGISGDYVVAGALEDDDLGTNSGSAYIFYRTGSTWAEQQKLLPADGAAGDEFGSSVAISGEYAVVGGWEGNGGTGAAYIFRREGNVWTETERLAPADLSIGDDFGYACAIDGEDVLVGCDDDVIGGVSCGSAYFVTGYAAPLPNVTAMLYSDNEPIIIPPGGGSFPYTMTFINNTTSVQSVDLWVQLVNPLGTVTTVMGPKHKSLAANMTLEKQRTQTIRATDPAGTYHLVAAAGTYPSSLTDTDTLTFSKLASLTPEADPRRSPNGTSPTVSTAYPNPFNPSTTIHFTLPSANHARLSVVDLVGREVAVLVDGVLPSGEHSAEWKADGASAGVYFSVLRTGGAVSVQKLMLLR